MKSVSYKIKFTILGSIFIPCFGRLALHGTGFEYDLYRYSVPLFVGGLAGYLIGLMRDAWIAKNKDFRTANKALKNEINESREMEQSLQESEKQKKAILDASIDSIRLVDKDMKIIWANKIIETQLGKDRKKIIGNYCYSAYTGRNESCPNCPTEKSRESGKIEFSILCEENVKGIEGKSYWSDYTVPIKNKFGEIESFIQISRDITELKDVELALTNAKKQWESTFNAMSDWVCIINKDHEIIQTNTACENLINLSADQVVGRLCHEIVHDIGSPFLDCPLVKAVNSDCRESMEFKTGDDRWLQITVDPIETGTNNERFVHIVRDITEAKNKENELILARKAKAFSILSGGIAHDYNNLLTIIWGNISLLRDEMIQPQQQELFYDLEDGCRQARDLTHQFITLSHGAVLKKDLYPIEDILSSIIEKAGEAKDIEISLDIEDKIPAIEIDPEGLSLAFENIICNAFEAMPDGGRLEILAKTEIATGQKDKKNEGMIKISFKDSGVGISKHNIDSVFDPYFTTKELSIQKGGGLGLAVSQSILKKHGGNVRVNSTLGQGTTIIVTLPITDLKQIVSSD
jgi:PAS domain S-box-containing protein